jgi:hypothetical protein
MSPSEVKILQLGDASLKEQRLVSILQPPKGMSADGPKAPKNLGTAPLSFQLRKHDYLTGYLHKVCNEQETCVKSIRLSHT